MHTCAVCSEKFDQLFLYSMHRESHKVAVEDYGTKKPETVAKHRIIIGVKHPVSDARKIELVNRGEERLGLEHFFQGGTK